MLLNLMEERREIWAIVRDTAQRTAVIEESVSWIKSKLSSNGRV
jgi:hypothetical protein